MDTVKLTPFFLSFRNAVNGDENVVPRIAVLLLGSSPPAIFRAVVTIVVDAVNGMLGRRFASHVIKEAVKVVPSFANPYPTTTIIAVSNIVGVVTTIFHCSPRIIFRRIAHSVKSRYERHGNLQAKVASIKESVASWLLEDQRFGSYPSHIKNIQDWVPIVKL